MFCVRHPPFDNPSLDIIAGKVGQTGALTGSQRSVTLVRYALAIRRSSSRVGAAWRGSQGAIARAGCVNGGMGGMGGKGGLDARLAPNWP